MFLDIGGVRSLDTLAGNSPLGAQMRTNSDGTEFLVVKLYNGTGSAMVAKRVYVMAYDGDEETNPKAIALNALASVPRYVVVATEATAAASWGWFVIQGYFDPLVEGTTAVAVDDMLKAATGAGDLAFSLQDNTTTETVNSCAIACAAQGAAGGVATRVFLFGKPIVVNT